MQIDQSFFDRLISGDRRTLGKAITLIESSKTADQKNAQNLLQKILPYAGKSFRLGITGVPGAGKSTFIENFGQLLIRNGHKVAVLAIDPSSPVSGGSILGDKTRMEKLSQEEEAFIRPSPSNGFLGGVAQKTREAILLCEAAGYDFIIIETVGVGQSEYEVASMVDFFMLLMLPNAGDELQGIKKGILELANAIIINKADGDSLNYAKQSLAQYSSVLELFHQNPNWKIKTLTCSALYNHGIDEIYKTLQEYKTVVGNEFIQTQRRNQNRDWFLKLVDELIKLHLSSDEKLNSVKQQLQADVLSGKSIPLQAAEKYVRTIF